MKFLIFNGSLKPDADSNTFSVCKMLQLAFDKLGHECEIVTLRELDYDSVTKTKTVDDDGNEHIVSNIQRVVGLTTAKINRFFIHATRTLQIARQHRRNFEFVEGTLEEIKLKNGEYRNFIHSTVFDKIENLACTCTFELVGDSVYTYKDFVNVICTANDITTTSVCSHAPIYMFAIDLKNLVWCVLFEYNIIY